jgi:hypothetical protein
MSNYVYKSPTFRLLKRRNTFANGIAAIMDLSSSRKNYNYDMAGPAADLKSIQADWLAVGQDIQKAIEGYGPTVKKA